jgi:hypothetical protein
MSFPIEAQVQRGLLVHLEMKEVTDRLRAEGFEFLEVLTGIASLANEIISNEHNQATASAWFFGMAKHTAHMAAEQMGLRKPGQG